MTLPPGSTSVSIEVQVLDDSGLPVPGLVAATMPTINYARQREASVPITLADLAAVTSVYSSGGVKERSVGVYRLDVPDAAFATASIVTVFGEATGKRVIQLGGPIRVAYEQSDVRQWVGQTATVDGSNRPNVNAITVSDKTGYVLDGAQRVKLDTTQPDYAPAKAGDAMSLTTAARDALVAAIEVELANDATGQQLMQAIADKLEAEFDVENLTVATIANATRDAILNRVLAGNHEGAGTTGKLLQKLEVAGTLAHTDNADVFKADVSGLLTATAFNASSAQTFATRGLTMLEEHPASSGTYRLTAAALTQAPTGSGGSGGAELSDIDDLLAGYFAYTLRRGAANLLAAFPGVLAKINTNGGTYDPDAHSQEAAPTVEELAEAVEGAVWAHDGKIVDLTDALKAQLDLIASKVSNIGVMNVTYTGPVDPNTGQFTIIQGDSYTGAHKLTWTVTSPIDLTGATAQFGVIEYTKYVDDPDAVPMLTVPATITPGEVVEDGQRFTIAVAITKAQTDGLAPSPPLRRLNVLGHVLATLADETTDKTVIMPMGTVHRKIVV